MPIYTSPSDGFAYTSNNVPILVPKGKGFISGNDMGHMERVETSSADSSFEVNHTYPRGILKPTRMAIMPPPTSHQSNLWNNASAVTTHSNGHLNNASNAELVRTGVYRTGGHVYRPSNVSYNYQVRPREAQRVATNEAKHSFLIAPDESFEQPVLDMQLIILIAKAILIIVTLDSIRQSMGLYVMSLVASLISVLFLRAL